MVVLLHFKFFRLIGQRWRSWWWSWDPWSQHPRLCWMAVAKHFKTSQWSVIFLGWLLLYFIFWRLPHFAENVTTCYSRCDYFPSKFVLMHAWNSQLLRICQYLCWKGSLKSPCQTTTINDSPTTLNWAIPGSIGCCIQVWIEDSWFFSTRLVLLVLRLGTIIICLGGTPSFDYFGFMNKERFCTTCIVKWFSSSLITAPIIWSDSFSWCCTFQVKRPILFQYNAYLPGIGVAMHPKCQCSCMKPMKAMTELAPNQWLQPSLWFIT